MTHWMFCLPCRICPTSGPVWLPLRSREGDTCEQAAAESYLESETYSKLILGRTINVTLWHVSLISVSGS